MSNTISVTPCGDFELWTVSDRLDDGFVFTLPIKAAPFNIEPDGAVIWFVRREMTIAPVQYNVLTPILNAWNYSPDKRGWWFRDSDLKRFAKKAPGITFDYYIVWPGLEPKKISPDHIDPPSEPGFSSCELSFLKDLHYAIPEIGWDALKVFWLAIRAAAIRRLSDHRTLDLGFVKIIPMPYRQNWKEALAVRFSSLMSMFGKPPEERHETLTVSGFYGALASPKLLALDRRETFIRWTLEMIPSPELDRRMEEHELARKEKLCAANYATRILGELAGCLPAVLEIMKWYSARVFYPPADIGNGFTAGSVVLVPAVPKGLIRPGRGLCDAVALTPDDAFKEWRSDYSKLQYPEPLHKIRHTAMIEFSPIRSPRNGNVPSRVSWEDKLTEQKTQADSPEPTV